MDARFLMVEAIQSLAAVRVLDLGCNAGVMLSELSDSNHRLGLDRSASALALARKLNPSVPLVTGDMLAVPCADATMDVVLYCGMLEVPAYGQKKQAIREVARVLRPGGRLYLTTANGCYRRYRHSSPSLRAVTIDQLRGVLSPDFVYTIRGFNPFPPFPYFLPNRVLAAVPGIWRLLVAMMERNVAVERCCSFYVQAVRK